MVKRGQDVWVKVISTAGQKTSLSMRDVDQATGADLLPGARSAADGANPAAPAAGPGGRDNSSLRGLSGIRLSDEPVAARRPGKRLTSPERWEVTQLIKAGVLDVTEYPTFDEEGQARRRRRCAPAWSRMARSGGPSEVWCRGRPRWRAWPAQGSFRASVQGPLSLARRPGPAALGPTRAAAARRAS
jgi:hypothetical protein